MIQTIQTWFLAHWLTYSLIAAVFALNLIVSRKSQIDAWCEANPRTAGIMKAFRAIGFDPWMLVQGILLILTKKLPTNYKVLTATTKFELGPVVIAAQKADTAAIVQKAFDKDDTKDGLLGQPGAIGASNFLGWQPLAPLDATAERVSLPIENAGMIADTKAAVKYAQTKPLDVSDPAAVAASLIYPTPDNPEAKAKQPESMNTLMDRRYPPLNADGTKKELDGK